MNPIRPELLAAKLKAASDGEPTASAFADTLRESPRLVEALWFLQWASFQPGGIERFAETLIERFPARFQTRAMLKAGKPQADANYSFAQCLEIWKEERTAERSCSPFHPFMDREPQGGVESLSFRDFLKWFVSANDGISRDNRTEAAFNSGLQRFNRDFLTKRILTEATDNLPRLLVVWCEDQNQACAGPRWCPDLLRTLCDFMDFHAKEAASGLAETEVTRIVFRELDFARSQNVPVPIVGDSRFGKTTAVSAWCKMHPGLARLVTVPESNRERDFFAAHADALGIAYHTRTTNHGLKRLVEFVHRHSGLFLVYDESHFLTPISYHKATPPRRLNWVRCQVIDRARGCAFFATPQSYRETLDAYVKKTGYCMEQWLGRLAPTVVLPESLDSADVLAVARNHFPEIPEPYLKLISARAMQSEGYLKNMELCVKRALFLAGERGRTKPDMEDVKAAIAWLTPASAAPEMPVASPRRRVSAPAMQPAGCLAARRMPAGLETDFVRRDSLVRAVELELAPAG